MKKIITICLLAITLLSGGISMDARTARERLKARTSQSSSDDVAQDLPAITNKIKTFYAKAILGTSSKAEKKAFYHKYCTDSFVRQLREWAEEEGGNGYATNYLHGLGNGGDYIGHVVNVEALSPSKIRVTYTAQLDGMGEWHTGSRVFTMKKENGIWKIDSLDD